MKKIERETIIGICLEMSVWIFVLVFGVTAYCQDHSANQKFAEVNRQSSIVVGAEPTPVTITAPYMDRANIYVRECPGETFADKLEYATAKADWLAAKGQYHAIWWPGGSQVIDRKVSLIRQDSKPSNNDTRTGLVHLCNDTQLRGTTSDAAIDLPSSKRMSFERSLRCWGVDIVIRPAWKYNANGAYNLDFDKLQMVGSTMRIGDVMGPDIRHITIGQLNGVGDRTVVLEGANVTDVYIQSCRISNYQKYAIEMLGTKPTRFDTGQVLDPFGDIYDGLIITKAFRARVVNEGCGGGGPDLQIGRLTCSTRAKDSYAIHTVNAGGLACDWARIEGESGVLHSEGLLRTEKKRLYKTFHKASCVSKGTNVLMEGGSPVFIHDSCFAGDVRRPNAYARLKLENTYVGGVSDE